MKLTFPENIRKVMGGYQNTCLTRKITWVSSPVGPEVSCGDRRTTRNYRKLPLLFNFYPNAKFIYIFFIVYCMLLWSIIYCMLLLYVLYFYIVWLQLLWSIHFFLYIFCFCFLYIFAHILTVTEFRIG